MIIAATGSLQAGENTPIVYRGRYEEIFPMMAEDGYQGVELHIRDSREIDRKELEKQLGKNRLILTSGHGIGILAAMTGNCAERPSNVWKSI